MGYGDEIQESDFSRAVLPHGTEATSLFGAGQQGGLEPSVALLDYTGSTMVGDQQAILPCGSCGKVRAMLEVRTLRDSEVHI